MIWSKDGLDWVSLAVHTNISRVIETRYHHPYQPCYITMKYQEKTPRVVWTTAVLTLIFKYINIHQQGFIWKWEGNRFEQQFPHSKIFSYFSLLYFKTWSFTLKLCKRRLLLAIGQQTNHWPLLRRSLVATTPRVIWTKGEMCCVYFRWQLTTWECVSKVAARGSIQHVHCGNTAINKPSRFTHSHRYRSRTKVVLRIQQLN